MKEQINIPVEKQNIDSDHGEEQGNNEKNDPELLELERKYQNFLDNLKPLFDIHSGDSFINYKAGHGFCILYEKKEIHSDINWFKEHFKEQDIETMIEWAHFHELGHFREYAEHPEEVLEKFDYIKNTSAKLAPKILKIWQDKNNGQLPDGFDKEIIIKNEQGEEENAMAGDIIAYKTAYEALQRFHNVFNDVANNSQIKRSIPKYEEGAVSGRTIEKCYSEKLFPLKEEGYRHNPLHLQLLDPYLRETMLPEEEVEIDPEVKKIRDNLTYLGEDLSNIHNFNKELIIDSGPGGRGKLLQATLQKHYLRLFLKDLMNRPIPKLDEKQGKGGSGDKGAPAPFDDDYKNYKDNDPGQQFDQNDIENWVNKTKEAKDRQEEEGKKTEGEKKNERQEGQDKQWCDKHKINYETLKEYRNAEKSIKPYLEDLVDFWNSIIHSESKIKDYNWDKFHKFGQRLNINKAIRDFPQVENDPGKTKIMEKRVAQEIKEHKPEEIRVKLLLDVSGSMGGKNGPKLTLLREIFVLLSKSLYEFNTKLNLSREKTETKLISDLEAWKFASKEKIIKELSGVNYKKRIEQREEERIAIIKAFEHLFSSGGSTADHLALDRISKSILPKDIERINKGELLDILIEITDGGADNANLTSKKREELKAKKISTKAFQIGKPSEDDVEKFKTAWEDAGDGERVEDLSQVLPKITKLLKQYLGNVKV